MKIRKGFVSNSSSCSFICEICKRTEAGYDIDLDEAKMVECQNKHIFCQEHLLKFEELTIQMVEELFKNKELDFNSNKYEDAENVLEEFRYEYPTEICPICSFKNFTPETIKEYIKKKYKFSETDVLKYYLKQNKIIKKVETEMYNEYAFKKLKISESKLKKQINKEFNSFEEFYKFLNS